MIWECDKVPVRNRRYCIDSNVLIQAKNGPYDFEFFPTFWLWLDQKFQEGIIFSSSLVCDELLDGNDSLAGWVRERRSFFCLPNQLVQSHYSHIVDFINNHRDLFSESEITKFLDGADPWVIALAMAEQAIVVTHERFLNGPSRKIKIPNICEQFNIEYIDTYRMLRELRVRF